MATIGDYDDDQEGYLDESMEWVMGDRLTELVPGYLTVAQCALLIPAHRYAGTPEEADAVEGAMEAYLMLVSRDIAHKELEARHPYTLLPYSEYLSMAASGMYGEDGQEMPMLDMGWLVSIDDAERWYDTKGIKVDLSELRADMELLQAGTGPTDSDDAEVETPYQRRHRLLQWREEEESKGKRGALARVVEREAKRRGKPVDSSNTSKDIEKARKEREATRREGKVAETVAPTAHNPFAITKVIGGKRQN